MGGGWGEDLSGCFNPETEGSEGLSDASFPPSLVPWWSQADGQLSGTKLQPQGAGG